VCISGSNVYTSIYGNKYVYLIVINFFGKLSKISRKIDLNSILPAYKTNGIFN